MTKGASTPTVVLVGRPNVGKSTLFNRVTGKRRSIVAPVAGTTRDVLSSPAEWRSRGFTLVDTGGLFGATTDPLHELVVARGLEALKMADRIVFVVDGREGLVPADEEIAQKLRGYGAPVLMVINKTDDRRSEPHVLDFYRLGFEPVVEVSAEHGDGVADMLDEIIGDAAVTDHAEEDAADETSVVIVGRPNVGKSSLVNRVLREDRVMVSEMPGTTRDSVDMPLEWRKRKFRIVDTAGMRRPGRVGQAGGVELVSVVMARRAVGDADVAVIVVDALEGAGDREGAIAGEAEVAGCGIVIAVNKWDLVKGQGQEFVQAFDDRLRFVLKFLDYAPLVHVSALTGDRLPKLLEAVDRVADARKRRVPTGELNRFVEMVSRKNPPVSPGRRAVKILYAAQTGVAPPSFVLFTNVASKFHFSYERFLVNQLRKAFGFEGTPIRLSVRQRGKTDERRRRRSKSP